MNIEKQERINTNIKTRSKNEKVSIKISFSSIALMSVTSFVGLEKMFLILHLKMRKVFLLPNVWKEGLLKLTITIGLQSSSYIKRC